MKKIEALVLLLFAFHSLFAQRELAEIVANHSATNVVASAVGDSVFISFDEINFNATSQANFNSYWVTRSGENRDADLKELHDKSLCGITRNGSDLWYYYFEEKKNSFFVKSIIQNLTANEKNLSQEQLNFPGKLLTSYVDKDLFLLSAEKDTKVLTISKIKGLKIIDQRKIQLSVDLLKNKSWDFSFIEAGLPITPSQCTSLSKIIKSGNFLFVILDEPADFLNVDQPAFRTTVIELDLIKNTSLTKYFFEPSKGDFRSIIFGDKVYRYTSRAEPEYSIYHFRSGKLLKKNILPIPQKNDSLLMKAGKTTYSKLALQRPTNRKPFILVDSLDSHLVLTMGEEVEHDPISVMPNPTVPGAVLLSGGSALVGEFNNGAKSYYFNYLKGNLADGFKRTTKSDLLSQRIDEFETRKGQQDVKIKSKLYISKDNSIIAIYNEGKKGLKVTEFNK